MDAALGELKERVGEIADLDRASALLAWDQQVKMPPGGGEVRAEQLATLARLSHEALTSDEMGRLLDRLAPFAESQPYDSDEASLIRIMRRDYDKARRVPPELTGELHATMVPGAVQVTGHGVKLDVKNRETGASVSSLDIPVALTIKVGASLLS